MKCFLISTPAGLKTVADVYHREMDWGQVNLSQETLYFTAASVQAHRFECENLELSVMSYNHSDKDYGGSINIDTRLFVTLPGNEITAGSGVRRHPIDLSTFSSILHRLQHNDIKDVEISRILIEKMAEAERRVYLDAIDKWKTIINQTLFFINIEKLTIHMIEEFTEITVIPQGPRSGGTFIIDCQTPQQATL